MSEISTVAIVMSRMPRLIEPQATWLSGLRATLRRVHAQRSILLTAAGTAGADFVARGAQRLGIEARSLSDETGAASSADQKLIEAAGTVFALGVRKEGTIHRLLTTRLQSGGRGVVLLDLPGLQPDDMRRELQQAGAELWTPAIWYLGPFDDAQKMIADSLAEPSARLIWFHPPPIFDGEPFLTHTTRACPGPWPRQSVEAYLDSVLDCLPHGYHSSRMTLARIVEQRLLIGSGRTIRGQFPVVSFTAVPFDKLAELRCFRAHRVRWDFEPFGVAIRRSWLQKRGARPVIYGTEETWNDLSAADRPFFQRLDDQANQPGAIDWSAEQEWRFPGDVNLSELTADDAFVIVPTFEDAKALQPACPWPITLWMNSSQAESTNE